MTQLSGPTRRMGITMEGRARILPWLFADMDVTFVNARYTGVPDGASAVPIAPWYTVNAGSQRGTRSACSARFECARSATGPAIRNRTSCCKAGPFSTHKSAIIIRASSSRCTSTILLNSTWREAEYEETYALPGGTQTTGVKFTPQERPSPRPPASRSTVCKSVIRRRRLSCTRSRSTAHCSSKEPPTARIDSARSRNSPSSTHRPLRSLPRSECTRTDCSSNSPSSTRRCPRTRPRPSHTRTFRCCTHPSSRARYRCTRRSPRRTRTRRSRNSPSNTARRSDMPPRATNRNRLPAPRRSPNNNAPRSRFPPQERNTRPYPRKPCLRRIARRRCTPCRWTNCRSNCRRQCRSMWDRNCRRCTRTGCS